jgi:hypothetical protein
MNKTVGEVLKEIQALKSKEGANRYLIKELQKNQDAWINIKYITGYLGNEERQRILNLFDTN